MISTTRHQDRASILPSIQPPIVQDVHDQVQKKHVKEMKAKAAPAFDARSTYRLCLFMECFESALERLCVVILSLNQRLPSDLKRQEDTRNFRILYFTGQHKYAHWLLATLKLSTTMQKRLFLRGPALSVFV